MTPFSLLLPLVPLKLELPVASAVLPYSGVVSEMCEVPGVSAYTSPADLATVSSVRTVRTVPSL